MLKTTTDYTGRKNDIMITTDYEDDLIFGFPNKIVTGIQKLIQIFITTLFNGINTKLLYPGDGTTLGNALFSPGEITTSTVSHILNLTIAETIDIIKEDQSREVIDQQDELLASAIITDFSLENTILSVTILLTTEEGSDYDFVLPIKLPIK